MASVTPPAALCTVLRTVLSDADGGPCLRSPANPRTRFVIDSQKSLGHIRSNVPTNLKSRFGPIARNLAAASIWVLVCTAVVGVSLFFALQLLGAAGGEITIETSGPIGVYRSGHELTIRISHNKQQSHIEIPAWTTWWTGALLASVYWRMFWTRASRRRFPWPLRRSMAMFLTTAAIGFTLLGLPSLPGIGDWNRVELAYWPLTLGAPHSDYNDPTFLTGPVLRTGQVWIAYSSIESGPFDQVITAPDFVPSSEEDTLLATIMIGIIPHGHQVRVLFPFWLAAAILLAYPVFLLCRPPRRITHATECISCGYNLTGNTSGRCPECGRQVEPAPTATP